MTLDHLPAIMIAARARASNEGSAVSSRALASQRLANFRSP
jgi:hypothetical protein